MEQLLTRYIIRKLQNYKPKAGKGKGIPFFSWEKYVASLLSITSMAPKDVARYLKVSYGVLRNWKIEPQFKKLVAKHREEFLFVFFNYANEKKKEADQQASSILKKPLREIADTASPTIIKYDELNDAELYSEALIDGILLFYKRLVHTKWETIEKIQKHKFDVVKELKLMNLMDNLRVAIRVLLFKMKKTHKDNKLIRVLRKDEEATYKTNQVFQLHLIISLLCGKKLTKNRKKRIVYILSAMKKEAEEELKEASEELEKEASEKTKPNV